MALSQEDLDRIFAPYLTGFENIGADTLDLVNAKTASLKTELLEQIRLSSADPAAVTRLQALVADLEGRNAAIVSAFDDPATLGQESAADFVALVNRLKDAAEAAQAASEKAKAAAETAASKAEEAKTAADAAKAEAQAAKGETARIAAQIDNDLQPRLASLEESFGAVGSETFMDRVRASHRKGLGLPALV